MIRAGYGLFYNGIFNVVLPLNVGNNYPFRSPEPDPS